MKQFFRTIVGKTILFTLCILSVCVFVASIIGAALMVENDEIYTRTEEDYRDQIREEMLVSRGYRMVYGTIFGYAALEDDGSVAYEILGENGEVVYASPETDAQDEVYTLYYVVSNEDGNINVMYFLEDEWKKQELEAGETLYTVHARIANVKGSMNQFNLTDKLIHLAYMLRFWVYAIAVLAAAVMVVSFIALMCVSGHRRGTEELVPGLLNGWPFDLMLMICLFFGVMSIYLTDAVGGYALQIAVCLVIVFTALCVGLGLCMSASVRIKQHMLLKNTLVYRVLKLFICILRFLVKQLKKLHEFNKTWIMGIPLVWRVALFVLGLSFVEFLVLGVFHHDGDMEVGLFFLEKLILIPAAIYMALCLKKLKQGGEALASGDLSHVTETKGLRGDFKKHAENLNSIAGGMAIAVEDRLKSERMKTELITNVSHDIKTPLTSIINYADLIGKEPCDNEKIVEYSEVLKRQSDRLKRLIEDLVEASKASIGNLEVDLMPCDASVFVSQADGEYEEKLEKADLKLITKLPEQDVKILADGRRMWRIFDNLLNNVCKYAQEGTRVYLSLEKVGDNAVFVMKNTSREALDMTEEELMERFTRGDSSRNTEGNGLGLSIARSLAELQGGSLKLEIDGDLFKAILSFPTIG